MTGLVGGPLFFLSILAILIAGVALLARGNRDTQQRRAALRDAINNSEVAFWLAREADHCARQAQAMRQIRDAESDLPPALEGVE